MVKDLEIAPRLLPTDSQFLHAASFGGGVFDYEKEELFLIDPKTGLITTEAGGTDTFEVSLTRIPSANVTLELESSDTTEGTIAPQILLFTPGTFDEAQVVTITGQADEDLEDQPYQIILKPAISQDSDFNGANPDDVSVTNLDVVIPEPGVTVAPTSGLVTTEDGGTATFDVVLRSVPTDPVNVTFTSSDPGEGTVAPTMATFNIGNATIPQTITITGAQDGIPDGDQPYLIFTEATSSDPDYNGIEVAGVSVTNLDDGLVGLVRDRDPGSNRTGGGSGWVFSTSVFLGAKFTVPELITVRNIGAHVVADNPDPSVFIALVPLGPDDFPPFTGGSRERGDLRHFVCGARSLRRRIVLGRFRARTRPLRTGPGLRPVRRHRPRPDAGK